MEDLLSSPAITLTVGPEKTTTTVQTVLFRGISEPLHRLLSTPAALSGDYAEINEHLQHDDKVAFLQLTKMAYSAVVKGQPSSQVAVATKPRAPVNTASTPLSPKCPDCKKGSLNLVLTCFKCNTDAPKQDAIGLRSLFELQFPQFLGNASSQVGTTDGKGLLSSVDTKDPTTSKPYPLLHFAKMFTFSDKYEVECLKLSSFKAFSRRLKRLASDDEIYQPEEVQDALRYLGEHCSGAPNDHNVQISGEDAMQIPRPPGTFDLLSSLVRFVVIQLEYLLQEDEFREIVADNGTIGLILMEVLRDSMAASEPCA